MSDPHVEDWRAALTLMEQLRAGQWPQPLDRPELAPGEPLYLESNARLLRMQGLQLAMGDPSKYAAARQWVECDAGRLLLTPQRLALLSYTTVNLGWSGLTVLQAEHDGLRLDYGQLQFKLLVHYPIWLSVLTRAVAFHEVAVMSPPDWVVKRLAWGDSPRW